MSNKAREMLTRVINRQIARGEPVIVGEPALYVIESQVGRNRWSRGMFKAPMSYDEAAALAAELEEHGNTVRVVMWKKK